MEAPSRARILAAWGVHLYTGLGIPLAMLSAFALAEGDGPRFFFLNLLAILVDGSDGALARAVRVKEVVSFDGGLLDNIIDFLTFAFLPGLALPALGLLPHDLAWVAVLPVMASGYQFCQTTAKTEESFVGFPSYWNLMALYLFVLQPPVAVSVGLILGLTALVFVPIHYIYPSRTKLLRRWTVGLGIVWFLACVAIALRPEASWARPVAWVSLSYVLYYIVVSAFHHRQQTRG